MTRLLHLLLLSLLCAELPARELMLYTEENPPINYSQAGELEGMAVEVVRELLQLTDSRAQILSVPWARGYRMATIQPMSVCS